MAYASQQDLVNVGLPQVAIGNLSAPQINAELQSASDIADAYFRARYGTDAVPLAVWDSSITTAVAKIAAFELMVIRGMKPGGPDFALFRTRYEDAVEYLNKIQRQQAHPKVTLAGSAQAPAQPAITTSSVVNLSNGSTATKRGW